MLGTEWCGLILLQAYREVKKGSALSVSTAESQDSDIIP